MKRPKDVGLFELLLWIFVCICFAVGAFSLLDEHEQVSVEVIENVETVENDD